MKKLQLNVMEILMKHDSVGIVVANIESVLVLRSLVLSPSMNMTMLAFCGYFAERVWARYHDENVTQKMMDYLYQITAKLFNHLFLPFLEIPRYKKEKMSVLNVRGLREWSQWNECGFVSSSEWLALSELCALCGSPEDAHSLIVCRRCAVCVHSYCIRSSTDFAATDNTWFCYRCLWRFHIKNEHEMLQQMALKKDSEQTEEAEELWVLMGSHLKSLHQISKDGALSQQTLDDFIVENKVPLWMKPLLCDPIKDGLRATTKKKERLRSSTDSMPLGVTPSLQEVLAEPNRYKSASFSTLKAIRNNEDDRRCQLCQHRRHRVCGRLLPVGCTESDAPRQRECEWVHSQCALAATQCQPRFVNACNTVYVDLTETLNASKQYQCHICHQMGASIHCAVADCTLSFHFPCVHSLALTQSVMVPDGWRLDARPFFCNFHGIHFERNQLHQLHAANLFDECLVVLLDRNNNHFVSSPPKGRSTKQLWTIKGNAASKTIKDRKGDIVLFETVDTFWSYKTKGKRTKFIYESYPQKANNQILYKLVVADDPTDSKQEFCGNDKRDIFEKMRQKFPPHIRSDSHLFDEKFKFFL